MKKGGSTERKKLGFTIVETMIVLAVSGGLFVIAALYINGRQAKTEFQVGIRDAQTKIQQVINEVNSGYYPSSTFSCTGSTVSNLTLGAFGTGQGQHDNCIFVGKTVVMSGSTIYVFPLAGNRALNKQDVENPIEAHVTAIAPSTANPDAPNIVETYTLPNGLAFMGRYTEDGGTPSSTTPYGFSVMSSFAQASGATIGSQSVDLYGFSPANSFSLASATTPTGMANVINGEYRKTGAFPERKELRFCLQSGGTNQSVWIIVGDSTNGGSAVRTEIKGNTSCA